MGEWGEVCTPKLEVVRSGGKSAEITGIATEERAFSSLPVGEQLSRPRNVTFQNTGHVHNTKEIQKNTN